MLDQRRRRWADVVQMLYKCFLRGQRSKQDTLCQNWCGDGPTSKTVEKHYTILFQSVVFGGLHSYKCDYQSNQH